MILGTQQICHMNTEKQLFRKQLTNRNSFHYSKELASASMWHYHSNFND